MRATTLTHDDLTELQTTLEAIDAADEAIRDLWERCRRTRDDWRVSKLGTATIYLGRAREDVERAFR